MKQLFTHRSQNISGKLKPIISKFTPLEKDYRIDMNLKRNLKHLLSAGSFTCVQIIDDDNDVNEDDDDNVKMFLQFSLIRSVSLSSISNSKQY